MSTTVEDLQSPENSEPVVASQYVNEDGQPNVALLQDRTPQWMRASAAVAGLTSLLGLIFLVLSYLPLWYTDLWGHLSYGQWIAMTKAVPATEPFLPLAKGVPFIDTAWLSQLVGYLMIEQFGTSGIQFLYAASLTLAVACFAFAVFRRTGNVWAAVLTIAAFYWGTYQQIIVVRPQLAGMACFAMVFAMATSPVWKRWYLFGIPLVFALWANVHGSFIVGLAMLGALTVGRALDVAIRTKSLKYVFAERGTRGLLLATELSAVAVLLNPYGLAVYPEVFAVSANENLKSLIEWDPLTLRMKQGQAALVMGLALVAMLRLSPRRVTMREVLLLCGLGVGMLWHSRMICWWAPVAAYYLGLHAAAVWRKYRGPRTKARRSGGLWTVVTLGMIWICFAYTPFGMTVLHGQPKDPEQAAARHLKSLSPQTPIELTGYLNENPPQGLVFNTYEWGDYLLWAGPENIQLFLNSHAHLIPSEVWQDYFVIAHGAGGWQEKLDRYGINAVVVDQASRKALIEALERDAKWEKRFADQKGAVFFRKTPI